MSNIVQFLNFSIFTSYLFWQGTYQLVYEERFIPFFKGWLCLGVVDLIMTIWPLLLPAQHSDHLHFVLH